MTKDELMKAAKEIIKDQYGDHVEEIDETGILIGNNSSNIYRTKLKNDSIIISLYHFVEEIEVDIEDLNSNKNRIESNDEIVEKLAKLLGTDKESAKMASAIYVSEMLKRVHKK